MSRTLIGAMFVLGAIVAACTPAAQTTTPPGGTPGATGTGSSVATPAVTPAPTAPPVGGGSECAPFATLNPASPALPSFAPDPAIEAVFPAQIDGSAREDVQSGSWLAFICFYGGQKSLDELKQQGGNSALISNLTFGNADYTVGDDDVSISAFRVAGTDANQIIQNVTLFVAAAFGQTPEPSTTTQANVGGKNVYVITDSEGEISYAYVIGDVVVAVSDVEPDEAATIFAAFP